MKTKCTNCGIKFTMGVNGICDPKDLCDSCAHVSRDFEGEIWEDGVEFQEYVDLDTLEHTVISRETAFKQPKFK